MKHRAKFVLAVALLSFECIPGMCATPDFDIKQPKASNQVLVSVAKAGNYRLEIDDAPGFRSPVWTRTFRSKNLGFDTYEAGMAPGVVYYFRLNGTGQVKRFRLAFDPLSEPPVDCRTLRDSWETIGRAAVERRSAVQWQSGTERWVPSATEKPTGLNLYFTELYLRSALQWAHFCGDMRLYDEISQYYLLMLQQTVPLGVAELGMSLAVVPKSGLMAARTFRAGGALIGDVELGNVQWLYPAAKLMRLISLLPAGQRSPLMQQFVSQYTGFIVDEQLLRFLTRPARPAPGGGTDVSRVTVWDRTLRGLKGKTVWDTAMSDVDLWLLASTAEVLGAHANDPSLAPLNEQQVAQLHAALQTGILLFRSKRTIYPDTKDFRGKLVGSATYFNGDYDTHPELAYSAAIGSTFPTADQKRATPDLSWDISHAYRIPVFLRALYENKKVTKSDFPQMEELQLLTNQYVYRVFNGDFSRPLFRNYLDGHDTWFRVDAGSNFGYPPSQFCDMRVSKRPCMSPGQIAGWGLLAFVNPDLVRLEQALVRLAFEDSADAREFRNRHHSYPGPFEIVHANGKTAYGDTLFLLIADNAPMMAR